jgi:hypothetical protein
MKHTFVLIDKIVELLSQVPRQTIETEERKIKAWKLCGDLNLYIETLKKLIENHKKAKYLRKLHAAHISEISDWADQVTKLLEKFDSFLDTLETDLNKVRHAIINEPEKWQLYIHDLSFGVYLSGLHDEEKAMKRFRKIAIFEMHELNRMIPARHMAEIESVLELLE